MKELCPNCKSDRIFVVRNGVDTPAGSCLDCKHQWFGDGV